MIQEIFYTLYVYVIKNAPTFFSRLFLAIGVCIILYIVIRIISYKAQERIQWNALVIDAYTIKSSALIGSIIFITLMIFNILIGFKIIWLNVGLLIGGMTFAIGYAMQTPIGNLMAWIILIMHKRLKLGVMIKLHGSLKTVCIIEEINIRHVIIRTIQRQRVLIPNMKFLATPFQTFKEEKLTRWELDIKVRRYYNQEQVKKIIMDIVQENKHIVNKEMALLYVLSFSGKGLIYRLIFFCNPLEKKGVWWVTCTLRKKINMAFTKHGIERTYENVDIEEERPDTFKKQVKEKVAAYAAQNI